MSKLSSYELRMRDSHRRFSLIVDELVFDGKPTGIKLTNANHAAREKRHTVEIRYGTQCAQWILDILVTKHLPSDHDGDVALQGYQKHLRPRMDLGIASQPWMVQRPFTMEHPRGVLFEPRPYQKDAMKMFEKGIDQDVDQMIVSMGRRMPRYFFHTPQVSLKDLADFDHPFEKKVLELSDTHYELSASNVGKPRAVTQLPFITTQLLAKWLRNNSVGKR